MSFFDVLIVGSGSAALAAAAFTLVPQRYSVLLFETGDCSTPSTHHRHGIEWWPNRCEAFFHAWARRKLGFYDCFTKSDVEVTSLTKIDGGFQATDKTGATFKGKKVILTSGVMNVFPNIPGYADCFGRGIFHEFLDPSTQYRPDYQRDPSGFHSGILAIDPTAMLQFDHQLRRSYQIPHPITIYTHGNKEMAETVAPFCDGRPWEIDNRKIVKLELSKLGPSAVEITFEDGTTVTEAYIGHAPIVQLGGSFAQQLGLETTLPWFETNVPGVYAAGDGVSPCRVWPSACASGLLAALGLHWEAAGVNMQ
ncbi:thioredoxin reductase [Xylaria sp. FL0933]|nr:thioredoxin reductase [Xylaria sp. FL0933]